MSLAYRLRLFSLDRWNLVADRLTRYRTWEGASRRDGWTAPTTPASGPSAGGSRSATASMRGYKRTASRAPRQPPHRRHGQRAGRGRVLLEQSRG